MDENCSLWRAGDRSVAPVLPGLTYASSGDFSHGPQHVFWTCSYQMDKSRDMSLKKNIGFLDELK